MKSAYDVVIVGSGFEGWDCSDVTPRAIRAPQGDEMLKIIDPGCNIHNRRQFTLDGVQDSHTFICEHGHAHRISFNIQAFGYVLWKGGTFWDRN
jgi:hypothetical protein